MKLGPFPGETGRWVVTSVHIGDVGNFSYAQCIGVALLVSRFLLEEFSMCVAVGSVCLLEEVSSGSSHVSFLDQN